MLNDAHKNTFLKIFKDVKQGNLVSPRGQLIIELEDYTYTLPPYVRFQSFKTRKLSLNYVKREFLWYLRGNKFDLSICDHAKMWGTLVNEDGSINSNYGQYIFGDINQFDNVVKILSEDKDSRRASIVILNKDHLLSDTKDVPCTYALNFRIRNDHLHMSVMMRSQDAIFGMGNDGPTFSFIHEMMFNALKTKYPELNYGRYHHSANSFHVYSRHFEMLDKIISGDEYQMISCPRINGPEEVEYLRNLDFTNIPEKFEFTKWLTIIK